MGIIKSFYKIKKKRLQRCNYNCNRQPLYLILCWSLELAVVDCVHPGKPRCPVQTLHYQLITEKCLVSRIEINLQDAPKIVVFQEISVFCPLSLASMNRLVFRMLPTDKSRLFMLYGRENFNFLKATRRGRGCRII